ncbi:regulatory helix-turn-helix protein, lysR family [Burkholderia sp. D7]|nr:regulatory helix-turn-helix protein, lysR family [Burkholderia sp. D7]
MDLRRLRYFVAVAEKEHFGRVAKRIHIVQFALSMQIRSLEEELGRPLFQRTSRRVVRAEAGSMLLADARRLHPLGTQCWCAENNTVAIRTLFR